MTVARLVAISLIFVVCSLAWFSLGFSVVTRSGESDAALSQQVAQLWGGHHEQAAPTACIERPRGVSEDVEERDDRGRVHKRRVTRTVLDCIPVPLVSSKVDVDLKLEHRRKGLLWYDTYTVDFAGRYGLHNVDAEARTMVVRFEFPSAEAPYDGFRLLVDGNEPALDVQSPAPGTPPGRAAVTRVRVGPGAVALADVRYRSRGLGPWGYALVSAGVAQVRDFELNMTTDFAAIDFPPGTLSPTSKARAGKGWHLAWRFQSLVTGQRIGMDPPDKLNPGPLAARITFFAPVSLLFFVTVMVILGVLRRQSLHPMHYFFLSAAFFAFHLLLAYLVDHMELGAAFTIAATVSVFLVVSYLRAVSGWRLALLDAAAAQVVYLVLFSYAFFFEGFTGLTVTVGAVVTLFLLMQLTARVDWNEVFRAQRQPPLPPLRPAAPPTATR
jgi:inner membrane protein CreD